MVGHRKSIRLTLPFHKIPRLTSLPEQLSRTHGLMLVKDKTIADDIRLEINLIFDFQ